MARMKITPYRQKVLAKLAQEGPLTLDEAAITNNIMPTLLSLGWARYAGEFRFEITDDGKKALYPYGQ